MQLHLQPKGSKTCGHHCVAMIAGITPEKAIELIGHTHGTTTKEIVKALIGLGFTCKAPLKRFGRQKQLPALCMLKMLWNNKKGSHWVVYDSGKIWCPGHGVIPYQRQSFLNVHMYPTSYLKIS